MQPKYRWKRYPIKLEDNGQEEKKGRRSHWHRVWTLSVVLIVALLIILPLHSPLVVAAAVGGGISLAFILS